MVHGRASQLSCRFSTSLTFLYILFLLPEQVYSKQSQVVLAADSGQAKKHSLEDMPGKDKIKTNPRLVPANEDLAEDLYEKQKDKAEAEDPKEPSEDRNFLRQDLALISILMLLTLSCCYCASSIDVEEVRDETKPELIQNSALSTGCRVLAQRPGLSSLTFMVILFCTCILSRHYARLKTEKLALTPFDTKLTALHNKEQKEYPMIPRDEVGTNVMIWNDYSTSLEKNHDLKTTLADIEQRFESIKRENDKCESLSWEGYHDSMPEDSKSDFIADSKDAVLLKVKMKTQRTPQHKENAPISRTDCFGTLRASLAEVNEKHGGLHVAMSSMTALIDASLEEAEGEASRYMLLSLPLMMALLTLGVGTPLRTITPFLVLIASMEGMRAVMVLIKRSWRDLNFSGPDTVIEFVMIALCFDYGLFFWSRFASERRKRMEEPLAKVVYTALTTSGYVIVLSSLILIVVNAIMCYFPNSNNLGFLGLGFQFMAGMLFVGLYSLLIPSILVLQLPSLFDEGTTTCCLNVCSDFMARHFTVRPLWTKKIGEPITRQPWSYIVPVTILICMIPLLYTLSTIRLGYANGYMSRSVPEWPAHQLYQKKFDMNHLHPSPIFLEAVPMHGETEEIEELESVDLPDSAMLVSKFKTPITFQPEFGNLTCLFVQRMMEATQGTEFQINAHDVAGLWWNAHTGECSPLAGLQANVALQGHCLHSDKEDVFCLPTDGRDQMMVLYKDTFSPKAVQLIERFWQKIEPEANWTFNVGDERYKFRATLDTATAEEILLAKKLRAACPWILCFAVVCVCCLVGSSFSSAFLMAKLLFTIFIPICAEYGLLVGIYQHGWLEWAGIQSVDGIPWPIVFSTAPFLFALALDYDIFLFARVYELRSEGYDNRSAVRIALEETGPAITMAGSLMCIAFFFVFLTSIPVVSITGCLYCLGVAIDTFVVRVWIAPSILCMFEEMNYWPAKMPTPSKDYNFYDKLCQGQGDIEKSPEVPI
jgi:predicted RND superfamily exporter protein